MTQEFINMAIFLSGSNLCKEAIVTQLWLNRDPISQGTRGLSMGFHIRKSSKEMTDCLLHPLYHEGLIPDGVHRSQCKRNTLNTQPGSEENWNDCKKNEIKRTERQQTPLWFMSYFSSEFKAVTPQPPSLLTPSLGEEQLSTISEDVSKRNLRLPAISLWILLRGDCHLNLTEVNNYSVHISPLPPLHRTNNGMVV